MRHNTTLEKMIEYEYINLAIEMNLPLVATNQVIFEDNKSHDIHKTLLLIAKGGENKIVSDQCYLKSSEEMEQLFIDIPGAILNSYYIAQRCSVMARPYPPMLPNFIEDKFSEEEFLKQKAMYGLKQKFKEDIPQSYLDRIKYELEMILRMKFAGYFLIVADFVGWAKKNNISVGPGRGSGVGSIVSWCLGISDVDPIRFGLFFERFLNPDRVSMPDFDIDFCQERRDEVINYVINKYGCNKAAHIITFGCMQAKAVIKDVARVLKLPFDIANYITDLIPFNAVNPVTLEQAVNEISELKQAFEGKGLLNIKLNDIEEENEINQLIKQILDTALVLEGLQRHVSMHAAGVVIYKNDLIEIAPLYKTHDSDKLMIQYSMKYAELVGLVKFDFLGLQTLTVISKCCRLLAQQGINIDISSIPLDDPKSYQLLSKGDTNGVFQFESSGMKDAIRRLKPDRFEDLIALTSLYRPGPMDNLDSYINRKHNKERIDYIHPLLETTLKETYGIIIYQEQVMESARVLSGYSLAQADLLRRTMGKKIKEEMNSQKISFTEGAIKNGISLEQAEEIFVTISKFAGYGFNKSHATGYSFISYQTAYLKAHYLIEFLISCLNLEINDHHKINMFLQEAKNNNIIVKLPHINEVEVYFTSKNINNQKYIVYGLSAIKNISLSASHDIVADRQKNGNYRNVFDFVERLGNKINKKILDSLFLSGSFDSIHQNRKQLYASSNKLLSHGALHSKEKENQQMTLMQRSNIDYVLLNVEDWSSSEKSYLEFDMLGIFLSTHPLERYKLSGTHNSLDLKELSNGIYKVKIAGVIQKKNIKTSDKGIYIIIQLSDQYDKFEVSIFNDNVLQKCSHLLEVKSEIVLTCEVKKNIYTRTLVALDCVSINDFTKDQKSDFEIHINNPAQLEQMMKHLKPQQNSKNIVYFNVSISDNFIAKIAFHSTSFEE